MTSFPRTPAGQSRGEPCFSIIGRDGCQWLRIGLGGLPSEVHDWARQSSSLHELVRQSQPGEVEASGPGDGGG